MKEFIRQFYNEGFATIFCLKPIKYLDKKVKNKNVKKTLNYVIKALYTIGIIIFAVYVVYKKFPFK